MQQLMPNEVYHVEYNNDKLGQSIQFRYKMRLGKRHINKVYIGEPFTIDKGLVLIGALSPLGLDDYKQIRQLDKLKFRISFHSGNSCDINFNNEIRVQSSSSEGLCPQSLASIYIALSALDKSPEWCDADDWIEHCENCFDYLAHRRSLARLLAVITSGEELLSNAPFLQLSCGSII